MACGEHRRLPRRSSARGSAPSRYTSGGSHRCAPSPPLPPPLPEAALLWKKDGRIHFTSPAIHSPPPRKKKISTHLLCTYRGCSSLPTPSGTLRGTEAPRPSCSPSLQWKSTKNNAGDALRDAMKESGRENAIPENTGAPRSSGLQYYETRDWKTHGRVPTLLAAHMFQHSQED